MRVKRWTVVLALVGGWAMNGASGQGGGAAPAGPAPAPGKPAPAPVVAAAPGEFKGGNISFVKVSTGKEQYLDLEKEAARAFRTE